MSRLTHLDAAGNAHMVDVSEKDVTQRGATASAIVTMRPETLTLILEGKAKKGDVLATARIAGIMAAKRTHDLIPLCHPLMISKVTVEFAPDVEKSLIAVTAMITALGLTHWNSAAWMKVKGLASPFFCSTGPELAIFQASQSI